MSGALAVLSTGRPTLGATVSPTVLAGFKVGAGTVISSQAGVVTVIGGVAPYTYLWTRVSGDTQVGPINGASSSTLFSAYIGMAGASYSAVYKCVVTDAAAVAVDSNTVEVTMETF